MLWQAGLHFERRRDLPTLGMGPGSMSTQESERNGAREQPFTDKPDRLSLTLMYLIMDDNNYV